MRKAEIQFARPFVKWVGGKTQLLDDIKNSLPSDFSKKERVTYVEPFVGGGAVLFWILREYPNITRAIINDINAELICTYQVIRDDVESLIVELTQLQKDYLPLDAVLRKDFFNAQRTRFNNREISSVETAALFIFLNRTCFNGLYRVNSKGLFNVPHGRYTNPLICDAETLRADSELLQRVEILCGDFSQLRQYAGKNVLFYLDPPYRPLSKTSAFTSYSDKGFDDGDQKRLRDFCEEITRKQAWFVASNSDPRNANKKDSFFDSLYDGFLIKRVFANRMINSKAGGRGAISELMISNALNVS